MFQIPCPMDSIIMNMTLINATVAPLVHENITSDDMCKPKYFIFNSQVTDWKWDALLKITETKYLADKLGHFSFKQLPRFKIGMC